MTCTPSPAGPRARFRPDPAIAAQHIEADPLDEVYPTNQPGAVPTTWLNRRAMGTGALAGAFADVGHSRSLHYIHTRLAARILHYGLGDLDGAAIRMSAPRRFTQEVSRLVYSCSDAANESAFIGIRYLSRLGDEIVNWAIFEPAAVMSTTEQRLSRTDPDLIEALARFDLNLADD